MHSDIVYILIYPADRLKAGMIFSSLMLANLSPHAKWRRRRWM